MASNKKLKLGWLIPYSGIFKGLKKDLRQGLDLALKKEGADVIIEPYPEFIQSGGSKDTEEALKKLLLYDEVDFVIGIMSGKTAMHIIPLLEKQQVPLMLLNLGADIPSRQLSSDYLFYNSLHLWKSEWVMGKWSQLQFGGEPSINVSVYEVGYGLHEAFRAGTAVSGAETVKLNVVKNLTSPADTRPLIDHIREQAPHHAHALLSGKEGEQFLQLFGESGLASHVALSVNPFMAEEGLLPRNLSGLDLYNATTWSRNLDTVENRSFISHYVNDYGEPPNAFCLLAYEAGLSLAAALQDTQNVHRDQLTAALGGTRPKGPRGDIFVSTRPLQTHLPVYIRKPIPSAQFGKCENIILETAVGIEWNEPIPGAEQALLTGWQNPYLCV